MDSRQGAVSWNRVLTPKEIKSLAGRLKQNESMCLDCGAIILTAQEEPHTEEHRCFDQWLGANWMTFSDVLADCAQ